MITINPQDAMQSKQLITGKKKKNIYIYIYIYNRVLPLKCSWRRILVLKKTTTNKLKHFSRFEFFIVCYCPSYSKDRSEAMSVGEIFMLTNKLTMETMDNGRTYICRSHKYLPDNTYLSNCMYLYSK